ncbi:MAG TPA: peptidyl-prolyl cis-trans isomerase [Thermoleophilaceae bacterium]|jgi:foldase protein PrsA|nr:peptidyl-prolyl cis-trans isomerase [Thermoleophilaceae bacterium]
MPRILRTALPIAACAALIAGCGADVPANGVAKIGDTVVTKDQFNHWLNAAAHGSSAPGQKIVVPDPPNFTKCVANQAKQPVPKGAKKPTTAQLKTQCKQQYDALKQQVMQFLVSAEWIQQEADNLKVKVSEKEVQKQFQDQKKQSFQKASDYQKFLQNSGMTEADLLFRVKLDVISNDVRTKVIKGKDKVTDAQVSSYYNKNKQRFAQPERRDLLVVLTRTKAKADQAKAALDGGQKWAAVAKKYSIDQASKAQGGKLPGVAKGQQEKAFDDAIFGAKKGAITGPVKTQFGYYVFEVTKITPASQQSLAQTKDTIRNLLKSQNQQKALNDFVTQFRKDYKDKTKCAKAYLIPDCSNAPKQKTQPAPASGSSPQSQSTTPQPTGTTTTQK